MAVIASPPPDLVLGEIEGDTGSARLVWVSRGHKDGNAHAQFGMEGRCGPKFRYVIPEQACYWWDAPIEVHRACAEFCLGRHGYTVIDHRVMARCNPNMRKAHGWE